MTTSTEEKPADGTVPHAWMITLQWTDGEGRARTATRSGTAGVPAGASRNAVTADIYANIMEAVGATSAVVLFFSLEPDAL